MSLEGIYELLLRGLAGTEPATALHFISPEDAYPELKRRTGQDFGQDVEAWVAFFRSNPETYRSPSVGGLLFDGQLSHRPNPSAIGDSPCFRELEQWIDELLQQRGFSRIPYPDCTAWCGRDPFWKLQGEVWNLCHFGPTDIWFGVDESLLLATFSRLGPSGKIPLPTTSNLTGLINWIAHHPDLPDPLKHLTAKLKAEDGGYLGVRTTCPPDIGFWFDEVHELINEIVDAFVEDMEDGKPWAASEQAEIGLTEAGVIWEQTVSMPDPKRSPFHSFTQLGNWISTLLEQRGFRRVPWKGSISWLHPGRERSKEVDWKLCYYGHRRWRFGVRDELVAENECLTRAHYDVRFYVPPDTRAIFRGFSVLDNRRSRNRIRQLIECVNVAR